MRGSVVERIPDKNDLALKIWAHSSAVERFSDPVLKFWATSSAVERFSDKEEVEGSTPSSPTKTQNLVRGEVKKHASYRTSFWYGEVEGSTPSVPTTPKF